LFGLFLAAAFAFADRFVLKDHLDMEPLFVGDT
jgi:hypothetical protein